MGTRTRRRRGPTLAALITFLGLSLVVHVVVLRLLTWIWPEPPAPEWRATPVTLVFEEPEPEVEEEEPEQRLDGQVVDLPQPDEEEEPDEADYLAEQSRKVEEETRTERYRINPEVLSNRFSRDDKLKFEDRIDLNVTEPSTGAQVGNDRFDPERDGRLASLPSPFLVTNKDGLQKPVPASSRSQELAGAPNNDLLDEKKGTAVNLNTREFVGAAYINRIRRLVNFYWKQNLDNIPPSVRFARSRYRTVVSVVLDGNGALENIEVTEASGSDPLDEAVVGAFRIAGPFPNPPPQLVARDGRVYLDRMAFTVELGQARAPYRGIDPRQGVQFPGILHAPR